MQINSDSMLLRGCWATLVFVLLSGFLSPPAAHAQQPLTIQQSGEVSNSGFGAGQAQQVANPQIGVLYGAPFSTDHLFGTWGGARSWLEDHGVLIDLDWLTENAGNISGGRTKNFAFSGQVGLTVDLDLQKLLGLTGARFHGLVINGNGRNLSNDAIGDDLATVQEIYGGRGNVIAHLVYAYGEQALAHDRVDIVAGWLPVGSFFASSPLYCNFMNVLFCGNPHPLPNYPGEMDWPQASFGGIVRVLPTRNTYVMVGLFSVDTDFGTGGGGISGWAWADPHKSGVSIPVEIGYVPYIGRNNLVGHYKLGYDRDTHQYADVTNSLLPPGTQPIGHPRNVYYALLDQMLLRQGKGPTDGLIAFGGWVHADARVSPLTQQVFTGLTETGAAWGRAGDTLGVAWHWIEMSAGFTRAQEAQQLLGNGTGLSLDGFGPSYGPQNTEQVVELDYTAGIYHGVTLMPDFQYIIRPGATTNTRNAAVLGFRSNINF